MQFLASYIMKGRPQAVVATTVTALLSLLLMPFSLLSGAAVGLVTLRIGPRQALLVMLGAALATALLSWVVVKTPLIGAVYLLGLWLPVWVIAASLRRTADLPRSILLAALFGAMLIVGFHLAIDDPIGWWEQWLTRFLEEAGQEPVAEEVRAQLDILAQSMTGIIAQALSLNLMFCLFIARWWQAVLYNPGGFGEEFRNLRLGKMVALAAALVLMGAGAIQGGIALLAGDLALLAVGVMLMQGLAVAHNLVKSTSAHKGWLVALYFLLLLVPEATAMTLALIGVVDNWTDFRALLARGRGGDES